MAEKDKKEIKKKYSKESLLQSTELNPDILAVVLDDRKEYTIEEAEKAIESFKKRKVE